MRGLVFCLALAWAAAPASAQTDMDVHAPEELEFLPNLIVPQAVEKGRAVFSIGLDQRQYLHDDAAGGQNQKTQVPVLLRANVGRRLEARLDGAAAVYQVPAESDSSGVSRWGWGDLAAGLKYNFLKGQELEMAFTPALVFPTGARQVTDGGLEGRFDLSAMLHRGRLNWLLDASPQLMHDNGSKDVFWQPNYAAGVFYGPGGPHVFGLIYSGYTPSGHPRGTHIDRLTVSYSHAIGKYTSWWVAPYMGFGPNDVMRAINTGVSFPIL